MTINKYNLYIELINSKQDKYGFVDTDHCDSLLFSGLLSCLPELEVNLEAAYNPISKQWHRRPISYTPCFPDHSKSTISRDMLLGLLWGAYYNKRLDIIEGVIKYALSNWMVMGDAIDVKTKLGRCLMTPGLLSTYCWASYNLGGPSRPFLRAIPLFESNKVVDFQAHLSVLHIILRRRLTGTIDKTKMDLLAFHANRQPNNPLFQYAAGNIDKAKRLLSDPLIWPSDRLPTSLDRHGDWVTQRDYGKDWKPSDGGKTHSGGDYLFTQWLIDSN